MLETGRRGARMESGSDRKQKHIFRRRDPLLEESRRKRGAPHTPRGITTPDAPSDQHRSVCRVAEMCGGCPRVNLPYADQLALKKSNFETMLERSRINPQVRLGSFESSQSQTHYRQSVKLAVSSKYKDGKSWIDIGLFKPGTHDVFDIGFCPAQNKDINALIQSVRFALGDNKVPIHAQRIDAEGGGRSGVPRIVTPGVRYVLARKTTGTDRLSLCFVTSAPLSAKLKIVARQLKQRHGNLESVSFHVNTQTGNPIVDHEQENPATVLLGELFVEEEIADLRLELHPHSFFQVNPPVAERMYRRIWELAETRSHERWLDLYCGLGAIGLGVAKKGTDVVGIDETKSSVNSAKRNSILNNCSEHWEGLVGRAEEILCSASSNKLLNNAARPFGVVSLNPSRRGCQPEVIQCIGASSAHTVVYMSCSQSTLFRDLERLEAQGFETKLVENFDMFPGTPHYETLAVLKRKVPTSEG